MMVKALWFLTILCALLAAIVLGLTVLVSSGAPQQAAGAAIAAALAIIPYVLARSSESLLK